MGKDPASIQIPLYKDKAWLYTEYWGKEKTSTTIAKEQRCSDVTILNHMKKFNIPTRDRNWTESQLEQLVALTLEGLTFREVVEHLEGNKTYEAIRIQASKLGIKSGYLPGEEPKKENIRQKISATLQGVAQEDWDGYIETENSLIRKSILYQKWRLQVFERDGHTCQRCNEIGGYLNAHHIENFSSIKDLRLFIGNGATLCKTCHEEFHETYTRKNNTKEQYEEFKITMRH